MWGSPGHLGSGWCHDRPMAASSFSHNATARSKTSGGRAGASRAATISSTCSTVLIPVIRLPMTGVDNSARKAKLVIEGPISSPKNSTIR